MAIPDVMSFMLPVLEFVGEAPERSMREAVEALATHFRLTPEDRRAMLPSGLQRVLHNRVGWAGTYLKKAGLLASPRRGHSCITELGRRVLAQKPPRIDVAFLMQFPDFVEFRRQSSKTGSAKGGAKPGEGTQAKVVETPKPEERTPGEVIEEAYIEARKTLAAELLDTIKGLAPAFFERLVIDLLVKMGYGGSRRDAGEAIGGRGDGGVDGIIKEDRLGLDVVYVQAKRWDGVVGSPTVHQFAGALAGKHAQKGVLITTSSFSPQARAYVQQIGSKIVLIDGDTLAQYMMDYGIGVALVASYDIKRIDHDYFTDE